LLRLELRNICAETSPIALFNHAPNGSRALSSRKVIMKIYENNLNDAILLQIFQRSFGAFYSLHDHCDPKKFNDGYFCYTEPACEVLAFVGLVEPCRKSPFGYRPTPNLIYRLLEVIAEQQFAFHHGTRQKTFRSKPQNRKDRRLLKTLVMVSGSKELWNTEGDLSTMLVVVGLANWNENGELIPTKALHKQHKHTQGLAAQQKKCGSRGELCTDYKSLLSTKRARHTGARARAAAARDQAAA
jgi:hypothetical protein